MSQLSNRKPPVLTLAWARQLERTMAEGFTARQRGDLAGKVFDREFGGAIAIKQPEAPWRNGVFCFSYAEIGRLGEIVNYFQNDGAGFRFFIAPMGFSADVGRALVGAGFFPADQTQAILYGLPLTTPPVSPGKIAVEAVTERSLEAFMETQVRGFEYPSDWWPGIKAGLRARFGQVGYHPYLVRSAGEPVGSAALVRSGRHAYLADAAVLPAFRGKGGHTALLQHRLHAAGVLGCEHVMSGAQFDSVSFRNQLRAGLQLAYVETIWQKQ